MYLKMLFQNGFLNVLLLHFKYFLFFGLSECFNYFQVQFS
jgi:hypothetical protein